MKIFFDIYSLKARLMPAILMLAPLIAGILVWIPEPKLPASSAVVSLLLTTFGFFLTEIVRDCGFNKQKHLWNSWGGPPTTQLLRWRNEDVNPNLRKLWHKTLAERAGMTLPTASSEAKSPENADQAYEAAVFALREKCRDKNEGGLLLKENISYGFRRNLLGLKPIAIVIALISGTSCVVAGLLNSPAGVDRLPPVIGGAICLLMLVLWIFRITPAWVRPKAFAYAERLLGQLLKK